MSKLFSNPTGAFGYSEDGDAAGQVVLEFKVGATVTKGQCLQLSATGTVSPVDTLETDNIVGVALDSVTNDANREQTVRVCVLGLCEVLSDGGNDATIGTTLYSNTTGRVTAGTATAADYSVGYAVESIGAVADALVMAFVSPQRIA